MPLALANAIILILSAYLGVGVIVGILTVFFASSRLDPSAAAGTFGFRMMILPGAVALWPILLRRLLVGANHPPTEVSAHRLAALGKSDATSGRPAGAEAQP